VTRISTLLLTKDEAANLPGCLETLRWCDDVVVLDSGSTDGTQALARSLGARVIERPFDDFASQRNHGLAEGGLRHPWVLHLDADERVPEALREEMERAVQRTDVVAFRLASRMILDGRWLRHAATFPTYQVRLTRRDGFRFRQEGHGQKEDVADDLVGTLRNPYDHHFMSKGEEDWRRRHERYAREDAREMATGRAFSWSALAAREPWRRRQAWKRLAYRLPARPTLRFLHLYVLRGGFLDGAPGRRYCRLMRWYETRIRDARRRTAVA
jgi:glycosyltransferase involved in cell wall biosynthesis